MKELKSLIEDILNTDENDLKIPQIIIDIANDINNNIINCKNICNDDVYTRIHNIKNILQVIDKSKWDWEYYVLKNIQSTLENLI